MISVEEAKTFLEKHLQLPNSWKDILERDELEFLRLYMKHHALRIPFQNATMAAIDKDKRKNPTESELIRQGLSGIGGCCINLNWFAKVVFQALGLTAFCVQGTHNKAPTPGTHCMVIVQIKCGDLYLVEVGGALPILDPVPMQNLPFRIISAGGFPYEFRYTPEGLIGRYHIDGGLVGGKYEGKTEILRTSWDLIPRKYSEFDYAMKDIFTNPPNSALLKGPMMYRYFFHDEFKTLFKELQEPSQNGIAAQNQNGSASELESYNFIFAWKRRVIIGDAKSRKIVREYSSFQEMCPDLIKYFPMIHPKEIEKACQEFSNYEVVHTPYDNII